MPAAEILVQLGSAAGALACFVDVECAAFEVLAIEFFHGCTAFVVIVHGDESESTRTTGVAIADDSDVCNASVCFEVSTE